MISDLLAAQVKPKPIKLISLSVITMANLLKR